jgi:hypothetical protein
VTEPPDDLEAAIDRLYQLPVAAFTEARNSLAAARRAAGDTDGASRVKALVKPSVVAWAVNQVFWSERVAFDRVVGAVREVLAAQRGALVGDADVDVRGAMRRKGEALQAAVRAAERKVEEAGGTVGSSFEQRAVATLEALVGVQITGGPPGPRPGRLVAELQASGFDMALNLAALNLPTPPRAPVAATAASPAPEVSDEGGRYEGTPTGDRGARTRLAQAEAELGRLVREVADAVTRLGEAEQRALAARSDVSSLEERLGIARQRAEDRGREEEGARSRLAELRRALQAAEAERDRARALIG